MSTLWISETDTSTSYSSSLSTSTLTSVSGQPSRSSTPSGSSASFGQSSSPSSMSSSSSSMSQRSPMPSPSVSCWLVLAVQLQLSTSFLMPSPSASSVAVILSMFSAWLLSVFGSGRSVAEETLTMMLKGCQLPGGQDTLYFRVRKRISLAAMPSSVRVILEILVAPIVALVTVSPPWPTQVGLQAVGPTMEICTSMSSGTAPFSTSMATGTPSPGCSSLCRLATWSFSPEQPTV